MKIAVTYEDGQVFQHFGHCENFKIYDVVDAEIKSANIVSAVGSGHGALSSFLRDNGIDTLICGGIGGGARTALGESGIELYPGVTGDADASVTALINGSLKFDPDTMCAHHHEGEHTCGENKHGCGGNH